MTTTNQNTNSIKNNRVPSPPLNYDYSVITSDTDPVATLLLDAKNEYNKQLISHLRQPVFNLMKTIYNTSEDICHQENTPENVLMVFQDNLAQVPKWSKPRRTKEYDEFLKISACDWFNELIKFCYITHVKILTIVNKPRPNVKLSISIPSGGVFFHSVCIAVARELWRSPFLFNKNVGGKYEYQKNMRLIEQLIDNSVDACIRAHIPMKAILMEYLDNDVNLPSTPNNNKPNETKPQEQEEPNIVKSETQEVGLEQPNGSPLILTSNSLSSSRVSKTSKLKISDELDAFLGSSPKSKDNLEPVNFTNPDELVDELEIIEPALTDDEPGISTATPTSILNSNAEIDELPEVILAPVQSLTNTMIQSQSSTTINPETDIQSKTVSDPLVPNSDLLVQKSDKIDEFDLDSVPEISLASITQIAQPDKPTTPELPTESIQTDNIMQKTEIKYIPINEMNEPGQQLGLEIKQPALKKKIIVEDLGIDDLDEVSLAAKIDEMNTFKKINTQQKTNQSITNKNEFAFF